MTIRTWAIGGEAQDDEGSARLVAHFATGGRTGILGPNDCRVLPLTTPGPGFRVSVGGFCNAVPAKARQKYLGEIDSEEQVTGLQGTGSSGGRHDLVVLRTDNPNLPGGGNRPADALRGPYSNIEVITGVPLGTKSFEALGFLYAGTGLARIEYPPSTATIGGSTGNAKIVDLRAVATGADASSGGTTDADPVPGTDPVGTPPAAASQSFFDLHAPPFVAGQLSDLTSSTWLIWPPNPSGTSVFLVDVPIWARSLVVKASLDNLGTLNGDVGGEFAVTVDGAGGGTLVSQPFRHEWAGQPTTVRCVAGRAGIPVAAALRGRRAPFQLWARRATGPGYLRFLSGQSFADLWVHFRA